MRRTKRAVPLHKRRWYNILKSGMQPQHFVPVLLFVLQMAAMISCTVYSYRAKGEGGIFIGVIGILTVISGIVGVVLSVKGLRKRKTEKFWCGLGLLLQVLYLLIMIWIFAMGVISLIG